MSALLIALAAAATPAAPADMPGIWEGTVGNLPMRDALVFAPDLPHAVQAAAMRSPSPSAGPHRN